MPDPMRTDELTAFFNRAAADWDRQGPPIAETLERLNALRPDLALAPERDVLEVGGGTGQVTTWLVEQVAPGRVVSIDFAAEMVERARTRCPDAEFRVCDICADEVEPGAFDTVFCMHAFPHFQDPDAALCNMRRTLRPGGKLVILHLARWSDINDLHDQIGPPVAGDHLPAPDQWRPMLSRNGMQMDDLRDEEGLLLVRASLP